MDQKVLSIVAAIHKRLAEWIGSKPTGQFIIQVDANSGGIRGNPKVTITENL